MRHVCSLAVVLALAGLLSVAGAEEERGPRPQRFSGEILRLVDDTIAVGAYREGRLSADLTVQIDDQTAIVVEQPPQDDAGEAAGEGGASSRWAAGTRQDLKVGGRVAVTHLDGVAQRIEVPLPPPVRRGTEGEGR